jgi:hypothetical protein
MVIWTGHAGQLCKKEVIPACQFWSFRGRGPGENTGPWIGTTSWEHQPKPYSSFILLVFLCHKYCRPSEVLHSVLVVFNSSRFYYFCDSGWLMCGYLLCTLYQKWGKLWNSRPLVVGRITTFPPDTRGRQSIRILELRPDIHLGVPVKVCMSKWAFPTPMN